MRWEEDFKHEESEIASDKMYFSKFLNEMWKQLIQISKGSSWAEDGKCQSSEVWVRKSVRTPCVYSSEERVLGDETGQQVTGQPQRTLRATPRTLLFL